MKSLEQFVESGSKVFRHQFSDKGTIENLLYVADGWKETAETETLRSFVRYDAAYNAVHAASIVVVAVMGYRITSAPGHHVETLEAACHSLNASEGLHDRLQAIFEIRNKNYKGILADKDAAASLEQMNNFIELFSVWMKENLKPDRAKPR
jgi:hypothetical protein